MQRTQRILQISFPFATSEATPSLYLPNPRNTHQLREREKEGRWIYLLNPLLGHLKNLSFFLFPFSFLCLNSINKPATCFLVSGSFSAFQNCKDTYLYVCFFRELPHINANVIWQNLFRFSTPLFFPVYELFRSVISFSDSTGTYLWIIMPMHDESFHFFIFFLYFCFSHKNHNLL